jgi:RNA polymerase sigma factor (sigma-70 family)
MLIQDVVREKPLLTEIAFNRLLEWLDERVDSQGETYLEMHGRLVAYFDRRNRPAADDLADETLNRIGRTLEKDGVIGITPPARYCYTVARFVLLEDLRREGKQVYLDDERRSRDAVMRVDAGGEPDEGLEIQEQRIACLERCLQELKPDQRALVIEYYRGESRQRIERRREMAKRLGITMNALAVRLSRIRAALEAAVEACRKERP